MRILLVAPEIEGLPSLSTWKELDQIGDMDNVSLEVLTGSDVTRKRVANRLSRPYAVVVFAGHGKPGKFVVADGCLTAHWLARYAKKADPQVILLAACYSAGYSMDALASMAREISSAGIDVIAMPTAVDDNAASVYSIEFVRAFSDGASVDAAHTIALEQMRTKTNPGQMPYFFPGLNTRVAGSLGRIGERFDGLVTKLSERDTTLNRRMDRLLGEQADIAIRMGRLEDGFGELRTEIKEKT